MPHRLRVMLSAFLLFAVPVFKSVAVVTLCVGLFPAIALAQDAASDSGFLGSVFGFLKGIVQYLDVALAVVGAFALVASKTPNQTDDKFVQFGLDLINFLGANFGQAKNE